MDAFEVDAGQPKACQALTPHPFTHPLSFVLLLRVF